jgi:hypothetical protein
MPIEPVDIPIVVPLESAAVPTQVPVAADVPVPVGLLGVGATAVGLVGIDVFPLHAVKPTTKAKTVDIDNTRIGDSLSSSLGRLRPALHKTQEVYGWWHAREPVTITAIF